MAEIEKKFNKQKTDNYSVVDMIPIREDDSLSWQAKGILIYMLDRPGDWEPNKQDIINRSNNGKQSVTTAMNELKEGGYLKIEKIRGNHGQYEKVVWHLTENPAQFPLLTESQPESKKADAGNPDSGNPDGGKPPQLNTDLPSTDLQSTEETNSLSNKYNSNTPLTAKGIDYDAIKETWNQGVPENLQIQTITSKRKKHLRARFKEELFDLDAIIDAIINQPFCLGENDRGWVTDFSWIVKSDENYVKVLEYNYGSGDNNENVDQLDGLKTEYGGG